MSDKEIYEILASDYLLQIRFDFRGILIVIFVFSCLLYIFENQKRRLSLFKKIFYHIHLIASKKEFSEDDKQLLMVVTNYFSYQMDYQSLRKELPIIYIYDKELFEMCYLYESLKPRRIIDILTNKKFPTIEQMKDYSNLFENEKTTSLRGGKENE
ncbi:hypothetical protein [Enterococcus cecorum]|uniref:hypothetical protein n=1 Tax=Enterococcus cecorum TaxID=44008 RepID=UPI0032C45024